MSPPLRLKKLVLVLVLLHFSSLQPSTANPDAEPLLAFRAASDAAGDKLLNWNSSADVCSWVGVSCLHGRVSRLVLEGLGLRGSVQPLASLSQLRVLSLKRNGFSGRVPDLSNLTTLKLLFLSHNGFSGEFPASVPSLSRLYRLDLSFNNFSGQVPAALNGLTHLLTLRLEGNGFSGPISGLDLPNLQEFNISRNRLAGEVPKSLSRFPESAFAENSALCGYPLKTCDAAAGDPTRPGSGGAIASPLSPSAKPNTVASSPSSLPVTATPAAASSSARHSGGASHIKPAALIAIIVGDALVLAAISLLLYCYFWRSYVGEKKNSKLLESEKIVYSSSPYPAAVAAAAAAANNPGGYERGRMVFFEGVKRFELEDLLRASAEMLGKGGFGTAYKAVLDDGNVVAVKRLKDASVGGRREFEQHMEVLGRLSHPNVVSLRAYYFAREEKLLVYDYMANGSLFWLLHGNRGVGRTPLDWTTRLKLAVGAARGLAFIHSSCKSLKLIHGNVKSTNILIDHAGNARVSDYGLSIFASPAAAPRPNGYRAPEVADGNRGGGGVGKITQKSDVYSFGVVLLELLTGKCPSVPDHGSGAEYGSGAGGGVLDLPRWVQSVVREEWTAEVFDLELMRYKDIEEEMVGLLQIAMACTCASPDQRPRMGYVVQMIEEIRGADEESSSPCHDNLESVSDSPSMSEGTCGTSQ